MKVNGKLFDDVYRINGRVRAVRDGLLLFHPFDAALFSGAYVSVLLKNANGTDVHTHICGGAEWGVNDAKIMARLESGRWVQAVGIVVPWSYVESALRYREGSGYCGKGPGTTLICARGIDADAGDGYLGSLAKRLVDDGKEFERLLSAYRMYARAHRVKQNGQGQVR